jgi:hypothetical protein
VQEIADPRWQLIVREPYVVDDVDHRLLKLRLEAGEEVGLQSRMPQGVVYLDGPHVRVPFPLGAKLRLSLTGHPLPLIVSEQMRGRRTKLAERLGG